MRICNNILGKEECASWESLKVLRNRVTKGVMVTKAQTVVGRVCKSLLVRWRKGTLEEEFWCTCPGDNSKDLVSQQLRAGQGRIPGPSWGLFAGVQVANNSMDRRFLGILLIIKETMNQSNQMAYYYWEPSCYSGFCSKISSKFITRNINHEPCFHCLVGRAGTDITEDDKQVI